MVHKTNNSQKFSEQAPFDVLLRRELRRASQTAAPCGGPCAGFDADTANAYLERALFSTAQQTFEAHLADCTGCRQHVTALIMLNAQLAPSPPLRVEAPRPIVVAQPSLWSRWVTPFASQFNDWRASFDLNWGFASAGAAMAALLLTFTVYQWQSRTATSSPSLAKLSGAAAPQAEFLRAEVSPAETALAGATTTPLVQANTIVAGNADPMKAYKADGVAPTSPTLPNLSEVRPQLTASGFAASAPAPAPMRVIELPEEAVAINSATITSPAIPLTANRDFFGGGFTGNGGIQGTPVSLGHNSGLMSGRLNSIEPPPTVISLNVVKDQLERQSRMTDLGAIDSSTLARESSDKGNAKAGKAEQSRTRAIINALTGQRSALGFVAGKGAEARTKEAEKTTSEPQANPLTKRVNGHLFYFERGFWIDENYRSDTTMPLVKLTRGTERYQNLLIENPTLEQFFQLGQVIVVWKGKVYEVRK